MIEDLAGLGVVADAAAPAHSGAPAAPVWGERDGGLMPAAEALGLVLMVVLAWLFLQAMKLADRRAVRVRARLASVTFQPASVKIRNTPVRPFQD